MKKVSQLLGGVAVKSYRGAAPNAIEVGSLCYDSRCVEAGGCFFAVVGTASDGHNYIDKAVEAGAVAVVVERMPQNIDSRLCYIEVEDTNLAMAAMAAAFYDNPSHQIKLVGVTGTNGKTTTATLLSDLFTAMGYRTGLISTVVYRIGDKEIPSTHTTPDALRLNAMIRQMVDMGCEYCFMEVSSHAIAQHRTASLRFSGVIFTNLTHDHLDYHKTFAEYLRVKKSLFDSLGSDAFAITNIDDRNGRVMVQNCKAQIKTLSLRSVADLHCKIIEMLPDGMLLKIGEKEVWVRQTGRFNAYNLLGIYGAATLLGADPDCVLQTLSSLGSVSGRFETIRSKDGRVAIVDYAHTPDALENVIQTIEEIRQPSQQLIVVCGCGGDRDRTKRPEMAAIAIRYASLAIFTSDNPRTESPDAILDDMTRELDSKSRYLRIVDRSQAIRTAVMMSKAGDVILIAGKGHETYQIVGEQKHHFDDREQVRQAFESLE